MTVSSSTNRVAYAGNGATTVFPVPFRYFADTDLLVVLRSAAGVETDQVLTTNYAVLGAGNVAGGTLTMAVPPAAGATLVILRRVPVTQEVDYVEADPFPAETHERALDRLTMIAQQTAETINRAITVPVTDSGGVVLPTSTERAGRYLAFDGAGQPVASTDPGLIVVSPFMQGVLDDADAAALRLSAGAQAADPDLSALAGLSTAAANAGQVPTVSVIGGWTLAGPLQGLKNLLINATFGINQRGFAGGALAAGIYGHDRWKAGATGCSYTVAGGIATITAGALRQIIEAASIQAGTYTLSWTGTAVATVDGVAVANGGQVALAGGANVTVEFAGGTFREPQLEPGPARTPFERRLIGIELMLCQRYFCKTFRQGVTPQSALGSTAGALYALSPSTFASTLYARWQFPATMRDVAAIATYNPTGAGSTWDGGETAAIFTPGDAAVTITNGTATTVNTSRYIHATASAEL